MRFRKRPLVIEAVEWTGLNYDEINRFMGADYMVTSIPRSIGIDTLEGTMLANPGDWIIRGVSGEFYPCKPDIFDQTYDEA